MTEDRKIAVTFRKAVSDGNYGTESVEITLEDFVTSEDDELDAVQDMLTSVRIYVHGELNKSPSPRVRQAIQPTPEPAIVQAAEDEISF